MGPPGSGGWDRTSTKNVAVFSVRSPKKSKISAYEAKMIILGGFKTTGEVQKKLTGGIHPAILPMPPLFPPIGDLGGYGGYVPLLS